MNVHDEFCKVLRHRVVEQADELDYTKVEGEKLLSDHLDAMHQLDRLRNDFEFLSQLHRDSQLLKQSETKALHLEATKRVFDLFVYYAALAEATAQEIFKRIERNGTNRAFALFKIASDTNSPDPQKDSYQELKKIALSIPWKMGWRHPDGSEEWEGKFDEVLERELRKHKGLDQMATFAEMLNNRFAYTYKALEFAFRDELRQVYRHPDRNPSFKLTLDEAFAAISTPPLTAENDREPPATIKFIELAGNEIEHPGAKVVLLEAARLLQDPGSLANKNLRQVRTELVRADAQRRRVSERQARNDLRKIEADVNSKYLRLLRERLRQLDSSACGDGAGGLGSSTGASDLDGGDET